MTQAKLDPKKRALFLRVGAGVIVLGVVGALFARGRRAQEVFGRDVASFCNAEAQSGSTLERNRFRVEEAMKNHAATDEGRALLAQLRAAKPRAASAALRESAERAGIAACPAADGYIALERHEARALGLDKMCREMSPVPVEHTPRAGRVALLAAWSREHVQGSGSDVEALLTPFVALPLESAITELRQVLAEHEVHLCKILEAVASPNDPQLGPNVTVKLLKVGDAREPEVAAAVRERLPSIRRCYGEVLAKTAATGAPAGALNLKFRVSDKGVVAEPQVQADTSVGSPEVAACATKEISSITVDAGATSVAGGVSFELFVVK